MSRHSKPVDIPEALKVVLSNAKSIAVLTGAGVSAESGIATFRDPDGLWAKFNPAELASAQGFIANPELVWDWYNHRRKVVYDTKPNAGHLAIAKIEKLVDRFTLITQNVDGLHSIAGSKSIHELHGSIIKNHCLDCQSAFLDEIDIKEKSVPSCKKCGGRIRPSVVWFGEMLPAKPLEESQNAAMNSDIFISAGTSGEVYPAAGLPEIARANGKITVDINPNPTSLSERADFYLPYTSGAAFPALLDIIETAHHNIMDRD